MKTTISNRQAKSLVLCAAALIMIFSLYSCSKKINFQNSVIVPAARGEVKIKKDNNNNYLIQVKLYNLAEVSRLQPPRQAYVVWMEADGQYVKNLGKISSSTSMLSKRLKASFEAVSAVKPTRIFITAEDDAGAEHFRNEIILETGNF